MNFVLLSFLSASTFAASLFNINTSLYAGKLEVNGHKTEQVCYIQFNSAEEKFNRGKHCYDLNVRFLYNLDKKIYNSDSEINLTSRVTNAEAEFKLPKTCAELTPNANSSEVSKWSDDIENLFLQIFSQEEKYNHGQNHYIVAFSGQTKEPSRAMLHRITWFTENSYECVNLEKVN